MEFAKIEVLRGLSQEALATDAAVDRSCVGRLERGLENPTIAVIERLAEALDFELVEFFKAPAKSDKPPRPLPSGRKRAL